MDELWERQRWSTQLKRKIKTLQKAEKEKQQSTDTLDEIDKVPSGYEHELTDGSSNTNHVLSDINITKENTDSASRESMSDESGKALSVEDVTVSIMNGQQHHINHHHHHSEGTSWKTSNEEVNHNTFVANFDSVNENNFANFDNNSSDFANFDSSSINGLKDSSIIDTSQDNSVFVSAENDAEEEEEYDGMT